MPKKILSDQEKLALFKQNIRNDLHTWCQFALAPMDQTPAEHHRILIEALEDVTSGDIDRLMISMPPGSAKALALDTPIPTPDGWTTMGELKVGDMVFGDDGIPCKVTWVSPIWKDRPVYKVTTDCGDEIIADQDHEWRVSLCRKPYKKAGEKEASIRFNIHETHELEKKRSKRPMIERAKALVLPQADLPLDPWMLGVWLGDGDSSNGAVTSSVEDQCWMREEIETLGYTTKDRSVATKFGVADIRKHLVALDVLNNKHIPEIYLRASYQQRLALLQGLIDTDGTACKKRGCATFSNMNLRLAQQTRELVRSLGIKAGWSEGRAILNGVDHGPVYRISFYHDEAARMPRKNMLCKGANRTTNTYIDVEYFGIADTVCIEVNSPTHLFLCGKSMTPTHNSTYASVLFPAWWMANNPNKNVILASHSASLAEKFSKDTRDIIMENAAILGIDIRTDEKSIERWKATNKATFRCVGVGGSITGFRADLIICDDLVRGRAEADSPSQRESLDKWYRSNLFTRLKPGGKIIMIGTRWSPDDIIGRLLNDSMNEWDNIRLPALCDDPENDSLHRALGEPLWPEWQDEKELERIRLTVGDREFSALYQQNPVPQDGMLINVNKFEKVNYDPSSLQPFSVVRAWDIASTSLGGSCKNPDFTVGVKFAKCKDGRYIVLDVVKIQAEPSGVENFILETARKDGVGVAISIPSDPGAGGKSFAQYLCRMLSGYNVETTRETSTKVARATPFIAQVNAGNVLLLEAEWNRSYCDELECFPSGLKDDQVDASSRGFNYITEKTKRPAEYIDFNIFI